MTTPQSPEQRAYMDAEIKRIHALLQRGGNEHNENARKALEKELNMREIEAWQGFERLVRWLDAELQKEPASETLFTDLIKEVTPLLKKGKDLALQQSNMGEYLVNLLSALASNAELGEIDYLKEDIEELRNRVT